jgi:hypothetical protein
MGAFGAPSRAGLLTVYDQYHCLDFRGATTLAALSVNPSIKRSILATSETWASGLTTSSGSGVNVNLAAVDGHLFKYYASLVSNDRQIISLETPLFIIQSGEV